MSGFTDISADQQIREVLTFTRRTFRVSSAVFYWVNDATEMVGFRRDGVPADFIDRYCSGMNHLDPLLVRRLAQHQRRVAWLADEAAWVPQASPYLDFLAAYDIVGNLEFVFWSGGVPFAGLGLLCKTQDEPLDPRAIDLEAVQRFIEFTLLAHPQVRQMRLRATLADRFRLTPREIEVVDLLCAGAANQDIADTMGLRLATVKTHVVNILDKLGVANRSAIVGLTLCLH